MAAGFWREMPTPGRDSNLRPPAMLLLEHHARTVPAAQPNHLTHVRTGDRVQDPRLSQQETGDNTLLSIIIR